MRLLAGLYLRDVLNDARHTDYSLHIDYSLPLLMINVLYWKNNSYIATCNEWQMMYVATAK